MQMKVLVYGAGVIGSYLAHILCRAGNAVTVVARYERKEALEKYGLVIRHHLQGITTHDTVYVTDRIDKSQYFDAVFAAMPCHKMKFILDDLANLNSTLIVLIGNNTMPTFMENYILEHATNPKEILFGFQVSAGKKEKDKVIVERFGKSYMDIGRLHGNVSNKTKALIESLFKKTGYKLKWHDNMEAYLICHPAAVLPIGYLSYIGGGNLRLSTHKQRKMMFEASHEAYTMLKKSGIPVCPIGDDKFYNNGIQGCLMKFLYFIMAKTKIGDLVACEHCRNAVSEMEELDRLYEKLISKNPNVSMANWKSLRSQMPSWEKLHHIYKN